MTVAHDASRDTPVDVPRDTPLHVAIVVGESSGDMLGASLMQSIVALNPNATFAGIGGPLMCALGFKSLYPMETLSVMGFVEPLKRLPTLLGTKSGLVDHFRSNRPDVFIGIDSPDFNLRIERPLKNSGIPTVHYVSPSVWAWRQGRIKGIRKAVDLVLCLLPFEADFYRKEKVPVAFVGHPMADEIDMDLQQPNQPLNQRIARQRAQLGAEAKDRDKDKESEARVVALLPGSRSSEIEKMAPLFFEVADRLAARYPGMIFVVPAASEKIKLRLLELAAGRHHLCIEDGNSRAILGAADIALVASGTATLETMLMKCPMVVSYKVDRLTYFIAKMLVKTKYISLVNLIAGTGLVKERIQSEADVDILTGDLDELLSNSVQCQAMVDEFNRLHSQLRINASASAARAILDLVGVKSC